MTDNENSKQEGDGTPKEDDAQAIPEEEISSIATGLFESISAMIEDRKQRIGPMLDRDVLDPMGIDTEDETEMQIISEVGSSVTEFGRGLCFVSKNKRMAFRGRHYYLDLLFYHIRLKRLVAVELKREEFKPYHKGQMEFYLRWLNRYDRFEGDEQPIGLILCMKADRILVDFMEMDRSGIAVAEYWAEMPPENIFEEMVNRMHHEARQRKEKRDNLGPGVPRQIYIPLTEKEGDED